MKTIIWKTAFFLSLLLTISSCSRLSPSFFGPELIVQTGHLGYIQSLSFSPDGRHLASVGVDGAVKLWDVTTGKEMRMFSQSLFRAVAISFNPDGSLLAAGGEDKTIKLWNVRTGRELVTLKGHPSDEEITYLSFSPDGRMLTSMGNRSTVLWNVRKRRIIRTITGFVLSESPIAYTPDSKYIARAGKALFLENEEITDAIKFWDIFRGEEILTITQGVREVKSLVFSPDGKLLASGGKDKRISLYKIPSGKKIKTFKRLEGEIESLSFSPDGKSLSAITENRVALWALKSGKEIHALDGNFSSNTTLAYSPDGIIVASGGSKDSISVFEAKEQEGPASPGKDLTLSSPLPKEGLDIVTRVLNNKIRLWDLKTGKEFSRLAGYGKSITSLAFSPKEKLILFGDTDNGVKLWRTDSAAAPALITSHDAEITALTFSTDGKLAASGSKDQTIKLIDLATRQEKETLAEENGGVLALDFSPDGRYLASGNNDHSVTFWDLSSSIPKTRFTGHIRRVRSVSFSPNGKILATGGDDWTIRLVDVATGQEQALLKGHRNPVTSLSFSPDGKTLASASLDRKIILWDLAKRERRATLKEHTDGILTLCFSPDGKLLASAGLDNTLRLWNPLSGKLKETLQGHSNYILSLAFSPKGKWVASAGVDANIKIWETGKGKNLASLVSIGRDDFFVTTPDNYFFGSRGALKGVAFRNKEKVFPYSPFDLRLNRPDVIMGRLGAKDDEISPSYKGIYNNKLNRMGFKEEDFNADFHLPQVDIFSRNIPQSTTIKNLTFKVTANDEKYRLDRLIIKINNVPIKGPRGISLKELATREFEDYISVELSTGLNHIEVFAINEKGVASFPSSFEVLYEGYSTKPDLYALTIGISQYKDASANLTLSASDAETFGRLLKERGDHFANIHQMSLTDFAAGKEEILKGAEFLKRAKVDDHVVLFLSGWLLFDSRNFYVATSETDFAGPAARSFTLDSLAALLDEVEARKKYLLLDLYQPMAGANDSPPTPSAGKSSPQVRAYPLTLSSLSGANRLPLEDSAGLLRETLTLSTNFSGAVVLGTLSDHKFDVHGEGKENGAFTDALVNALSSDKADSNEDGFISAYELSRFLPEHIGKLTGDRQQFLKGLPLPPVDIRFY